MISLWNSEYVIVLAEVKSGHSTEISTLVILQIIDKSFQTNVLGVEIIKDEKYQKIYDDILVILLIEISFSLWLIYIDLIVSRFYPPYSSVHISHIPILITI